jgi:hypothetical protein
METILITYLARLSIGLDLRVSRAHSENIPPATNKTGIRQQHVSRQVLSPSPL